MLGCLKLDAVLKFKSESICVWIVVVGILTGIVLRALLVSYTWFYLPPNVAPNGPSYKLSLAMSVPCNFFTTVN